MQPAARSIRSLRLSSAPRRLKGALGEMAVEVGHQPDRVRQAGAVTERGAALVVDQDEADPGQDGWRLPGRRPGSAAARTCPSRWSLRPGRAGRRRPGQRRTARRRHLRPAAPACCAARPATLSRGPAASVASQLAAGLAAQLDPAALRVGHPVSRRAAEPGRGTGGAPTCRPPRRAPHPAYAVASWPWTYSRDPCTSTVARHSTGRDTRSLSQQIRWMPTCGPSASRRATPCVRRSAPAPSSSTTTARPGHDVADDGDTSAARASSSATSSSTRARIWSAVTPHQRGRWLAADRLGVGQPAQPAPVLARVPAWIGGEQYDAQVVRAVPAGEAGR